MKRLIVSERSTSFLRSYIAKLGHALRCRGDEVFLLSGEPVDEGSLPSVTVLPSARFRDLCGTMDEERYVVACAIALEQGIEHLHFCFMTDPQRLYLALAVSPPAPRRTLTYSIFGLGAYLGRPIYRHFSELMLAHPSVHALLLHSNNPGVARRAARARGLLQSDAVQFVHDPIYDDVGAFHLTREAARVRLGLPQDRRIALYFGTFYRQKGADLLVDAARRLRQRTDVLVVLAGDVATAPPAFARPDETDTNIRLDGRFVSPERMAAYFRAADLIVLPYRRAYELDTSGVLVQACLAQRPLLVPDIAPFRETVAEFDLGDTFRCEDVEDLARQVGDLCSEPAAARGRGWARYLARIESWADLAERIA